MDWLGWVLVLFTLAIVLIITETEKAIANHLTFLKYDTADQEFDPYFDEALTTENQPLPNEVNWFGMNEMTK
jgi:hypothetical protein